MIVERLGHYSLRVVDLEASVEFYTQALGLRIGPRPAFDFPGHWLYLDDDDASLGAVHLIGADVKDRENVDRYVGQRESIDRYGSGVVDHLAFISKDWFAAKRRFDSLGIPYLEQLDPEGRRQVFLRDPNGVVVELSYPADRAA